MKWLKTHIIVKYICVMKSTATNQYYTINIVAHISATVYCVAKAVIGSKFCLNHGVEPSLGKPPVGISEGLQLLIDS